MNKLTFETIEIILIRYNRWLPHLEKVIILV